MVTTTALSSETQEILLNQCLREFTSYYVSKYGKNVAIYAGHIMQLSPPYRYIGLQLLSNLQKSCLGIEDRDFCLEYTQYFKLSVPFLKERDSYTENQILSTYGSQSASIVAKDTDMVSKGQSIFLPETKFNEGCVKNFWQWLSHDLGLSPSKPFYSL